MKFDNDASCIFSTAPILNDRKYFGSSYYCNGHYIRLWKQLFYLFLEQALWRDRCFSMQQSQWLPRDNDARKWQLGLKSKTVPQAQSPPDIKAGGRGVDTQREVFIIR